MRHLYFLIYTLLLFVLYFVPLKSLAILSFDSNLYSHFMLIPVVSLYFFITDRKAIFRNTGYSFVVALPVAAAGLLLYWVGKNSHVGMNQNDYLALMMFALFLCINGGFFAFYGSQAFRKALFPLLFLIFMVPIPTVVLDALIKVLLMGSADTSYAIFKLLGVPVYRDGFIFELPGLAVEVARQCSGIRSTIGMFITSVIAGYMFLKTGWGRVLLILVVFPITIFKNSIRITSISLLAAYVDKSWITNSWLHSGGGVVFFVLGLIILGGVLLIIQKMEKKWARGAQGSRKKVKG
jgi:exosortase